MIEKNKAMRILSIEESLRVEKEHADRIVRTRILLVRELLDDEAFHEEDDGRLPALSEASHLDLQKKQRNTLESLRRPFFKVIQVIVILNSLRIKPFMLVLVAYFRRVMATFLQGCAGEGKV